MKEFYKSKAQYFRNRDFSWLDFNRQVLMQAADPLVPLIERFKFLGIFSNNLDDFFRSRYARLKRISHFNFIREIEDKSDETFQEIIEKTLKLQKESLKIERHILKELKKEGIQFVSDKQLSTKQQQFINDFFENTISPRLITVLLHNDRSTFPNIKENTVYLIIRLKGLDTKKQSQDLFPMALIEIPDRINRFIQIPSKSQINQVMYLDDVIRFCMNKLFEIIGYKAIVAHSFKLTRDGQMSINRDLKHSFIEKITLGLKSRTTADPIRLVYDEEMGQDTLNYLVDKIGFTKQSCVMPGGRYHNRRNYMDFPSFGRQDLLYDTRGSIPIPGFTKAKSILSAIANKDYMIDVPYHSFSHIVRFISEAALDPKVTKISITVYRLAARSQIIDALIMAAKNGKEVNAVIELKARADELANIRYAKLLQSEGVNILFGESELKVHAKVCLVERKENKKTQYFGFISTGNLNERTSKVYRDYTLFTSNKELLKELKRALAFLMSNYKPTRYKHLIVSPLHSRNTLNKLIETEIQHAKKGGKALIQAQMNALTDEKIIKKLYKASMAGVEIQLIVRGACSLVPGLKGVSENIQVRRLVGRYLEHPRVCIFHHGGSPRYYISSADWMPRNLEERLEIGCPIYDLSIQKQISYNFEQYWNDNVKLYALNKKSYTPIISSRSEVDKLIDAQDELYHHYLKKT